MKKLLLIVPIIALACFLVGANRQSVYAVNVLDPVCNTANSNNLPSVCKDNNSAKTGPNANANPIIGPNGIITTYIHILALVIGIAAVVVITLSGLRFAISGGDPAAVQAARNGVLYAIVGLAVAVVAQGMVTFVLARL